MSTPSPTQTVRDLAGKRALISGGTSGTGAAISARLRIAGAYVTATGRHDPRSWRRMSSSLPTSQLPKGPPP